MAKNETKIFVAGSGRSGTTWIGDVLSQCGQYRQVFEPFLIDKRYKFPLAKHFYFSLKEQNLRRDYSLYLPATNASYKYHGSIRRLLSLPQSRQWVNHYRDLNVVGQKGILVKEIRANLLLDYLRTFWPEIRYIWVVRNPFEVIASQLRQRSAGWSFDWDPSCVLNQTSLVSTYLQPFLSIIRQPTNITGRLAIRWCIENYIPRIQFGATTDVFRVFYDKLMKTPSHWQELLNYCQIDGIRKADLNELLKKRSVTSSEKTRFGGLNAEDISTIAQTIEAFGLSDLNGQ